MSTGGSSSAATLMFWGAARSVTGSMHLLEANGQRILLDCGLVRDRHHHAHASPFPFSPREIDAVVLSHAHIDHCGHLPALIRRGFQGPIYCTGPTQELVAVMLANSARHHEEDARTLQIIGQHAVGADDPLFTGRDVGETVGHCVPLAYDESREIAPGIELRLLDAGHILGSAMVSLTIEGQSRTARLLFTGDLGRRQPILLRSPAMLPDADVIVSESTYGSRVLEPLDETLSAFERWVRQSIDRNGAVLIPAFSLGRTQAVLYAVQQGMAYGRIPRVPVFVDSPTATAISAVYGRHARYFALSNGELAGAVLHGDSVHYLRSTDESHELDQRREPCIIIAPSGMCDGGRILRHLSRFVDDPRCTIILVSYQAPNTPGWQLLQRRPTVRFHGRKWNKWAEVIYLAGFSGHADRDDLLALLKPRAKPARVRLVHGELTEAEALADGLKQQGYTDIAIPERGDQVSLFG